MLYVGCAYGFWTEAFVSVKGNKTKLKAGTRMQHVNLEPSISAASEQDWSDLQGTRLRRLVGYLCKVIQRTPFARTVRFGFKF